MTSGSRRSGRRPVSRRLRARDVPTAVAVDAALLDATSTAAEALVAALEARDSVGLRAAADLRVILKGACDDGVVVHAAAKTGTPQEPAAAVAVGCHTYPFLHTEALHAACDGLASRGDTPATARSRAAMLLFALAATKEERMSAREYLRRNEQGEAPTGWRAAILQHLQRRWTIEAARNGVAGGAQTPCC